MAKLEKFSAPNSEGKSMRAMALMCAALFLSSCATISAQKATSTPDQETAKTVCNPLDGGAYETIDFFFGLSIKGDKVGVTEADWNRFLNTHIIKAFEYGFSVTDQQGAWREDGETKTERSKRVTAIVPISPDNAQKILKLTDTYRTLFRQDSVLVNRYPSKAISCEQRKKKPSSQSGGS